MDERILSLIKKCLALSKSDNPNEAATALKNAQVLMQKHGISADDLTFADMGEAQSWISTKGTKRWEVVLIDTVCRLFGVAAYKRIRPGAAGSVIIFCGEKHDAAVADYTYDVLYRQILRARGGFLRGRKGSRTRKTTVGDQFCEGFALEMRQLIKSVFADKEKFEIASKYMTSKVGDIEEVTSKHTSTKNLADVRAFFAGREAGKKARLHHGVDAADPAQQLSAVPMLAGAN